MIRRLPRSLLILALAMATGCASVSWPTFWPFPERERTTHQVPAMRMEAITELGARATNLDPAEQQRVSEELARQIQIEPDPLVREVIIDSIARFQTPLAPEVLKAGLGDESRAVRIACCRALGARGDAGSVASLEQALRADEDLDVRLAAAKALGGIDSPEAIQALTIALDDRNPALQLVGVESLQAITGKAYGGDVRLWRQFAAGENPPEPAPPSVAERIRDVVRF